MLKQKKSFCSALLTKKGSIMDFTKNTGIAMKELTEHGAFFSVSGKNGINTMVISWGFIGMIWNKPCFIALVRPQRHTKKMLDGADSFTVSIPFGVDMKKELLVCGSKSGADIDKSKTVEFVKAKTVSSPLVKGCSVFYECRLLFSQPIDGKFMPADICGKFYKEKDFHIIYVGEIVENGEV